MSELTKEYGGGLFALAVEEKIDHQILMEARELSKIISGDYIRLISNPDIPKAERIGLLGEILDGNVHVYLGNFIKLMAERSIASEIIPCFEEFEKLYYEYHNIFKVKAESAVPLTEEQRTRLQKKLEAHTGGSVEIEYVIDKSLLGGMKITFNDRQIDSTIKNKLKEVEVGLSRTVV